jgi:hypothetical protein
VRTELIEESDAAFYLNVAGNVASGRGLVSDIVIDPSHGQPPPYPMTLVYYLYPLLVGGLARLVASLYTAAKIVSLAGSTAWLGLFAWLLWRARSPRSILDGIAFAACFGVVGLHPGLSTYGFLAYSENIYFPLLAVVAIAYDAWSTTDRLGPWTLLGALAAVSMQARIEGLLLAGALAVCSVLSRGEAEATTARERSVGEGIGGVVGAGRVLGRRLARRTLPLALGFAIGALPLFLLQARLHGDPLHGLKADLRRTAAGTRQAPLQGSLLGRLAGALLEGSRRALDPREDRSLHASVGPFLGVGVLGFAVAWWPRRPSVRDPVALLFTVYSAFILGALTFRQEAEPFRWHYDRRYAFVLIPALAYHVWLAWSVAGRVVRALLLGGMLAVGLHDAREARGFHWTSANFWFRDPPSALALAERLAALPPEATVLTSDAAYLNFKARVRTVLLYPYPGFPSVSWLVERYGVTHVAVHQGEERFVQDDPIAKKLAPIARVSSGGDGITLYGVQPEQPRRRGAS